MKRYTPEQKAWFFETRTLPLSEAYADFCKRWGPGRTVVAIQSMRQLLGATTGRLHSNHSTKPRPLGHERVDFGVVVVKVERPDASGRLRARYVKKHILLWEQQHGPIPAGMCLTAINGRGNPDPSNWRLMPLVLRARLGRQGFSDMPVEVRPAMVANELLKHAIFGVRKEGKSS